MANSQRKRTVLSHAMGLLAGRWGEGLTTFMGLQPEPEPVPTLPTGFKQLDQALGLGGLPLGRITELIGPDVRGTTALAARIATKVQRKQQTVTIIDPSRAFDLNLATRCGLGVPELLMVRPDNAFQILSAVERATRVSGLALLVLDTVKETFGQANAALLKAFLGRLRTIVSRAPAHCALFCLTTPTENDPLTSLNYPAGFPLYEVADVRIWIQADKWSYQAGLRSSYRSTLTVIKNRLAPSGKGAVVRFSLTRPTN
jgi:recombination protein RecA